MGIDLTLLPRIAVWLVIGVVFGIPFLISAAVFPFLLPACLYALVVNDCPPRGQRLPGPRFPLKRINRQWHRRAQWNHRAA
jgi:hypothetical protein